MQDPDNVQRVPNLSFNHPGGRPIVDLYSQPYDNGFIIISSNDRSIVSYGTRSVLGENFEVQRGSRFASEVELIRASDAAIEAAKVMADSAVEVVTHINSISAPTQWVYGVSNVQVSSFYWPDEIAVLQQPQGVLAFSHAYGQLEVRETGGGMRHQFGVIPTEQIQAMFDAKQGLEAAGLEVGQLLMRFSGR